MFDVQYLPHCNFWLNQCHLDCQSSTHLVMILPATCSILSVIGCCLADAVER